MNPAPEGRAVFRRNYARGILGTLALSVVLAAAAAFIIPTLLPETTSRATRATLAIAVAAALFLIVWGAFLWGRNLRVVVTAERVEVWRPFVRLHAWDRATTGFSSVVTEHRTNGVQTSTTRALVAFQSGATTKVDLAGFERTTFNRLIAMIAPPTPPAPPIPPPRAAAASTMGDTAEPEPQLRPVTTSQFRIESGPSRARSRRLAVIGAIALAAGVAGVVLLVRPGIDGDVLVPLALVLSVVGVVGIGLLIAFLATANALKRIPGTVTVTREGLVIDGTAYPFAGQRSIEIAPSTYTSRQMTIVGIDGRARSFTLGSRDADMAPTYAEFVAALLEAGAPSRGLVNFDLG